MRRVRAETKPDDTVPAAIAYDETASIALDNTDLVVIGKPERAATNTNWPPAPRRFATSF
jgi:hypothetical protein